MLLFLVRHGQTTANETGTYSGQTDVMLTELGKAQAEAIRPVLAQYKFDRVYSSDLTRAIDTQKLAIPDAEGICSPLLREMDVGSLAGQSIKAVKEKSAGFASDFTPFGGESVQMQTERLRKFLASLEADPCERVVAFVHGGLTRCMLRIVMGENADFTGIVSANCGISVFRFDGKRWIMEAWNLNGKF